MDDTTIGRDGRGAAIYTHEMPHVVKFLPPPVPIINARDCELAGFDLALVLEAHKAATP